MEKSNFDSSQKYHINMYMRWRNKFFKAPHKSNEILNAHKKMQYHTYVHTLQERKKRKLNVQERRRVFKVSEKATDMWKKDVLPSKVQKELIQDYLKKI